MKTSFYDVESLAIDLENKNRLREAKLVDDLLKEATELEDHLDGAKEKIGEYEELLDSFLDLVEDKRKVELACYEKCSDDTTKLIQMAWKYKEIKKRKYY